VDAERLGQLGEKEGVSISRRAQVWCGFSRLDDNLLAVIERNFQLTYDSLPYQAFIAQ
jgi:hypothetical protein